jgi:hypothetical protein
MKLSAKAEAALHRLRADPAFRKALAEPKRKKTPTRKARGQLLPPELSSYFWQHTKRRLDVDKDRDTIIRRLVEHGSPQAIAWLRATYGDEVIFQVLATIKARGLSYARVRTWIPRELFASWESERPPSLWPLR